jgi:predicted nucleic acid-binding protein
LRRPTIGNIREPLKDKPFAEKVYAPVLEYRAFFESLAFLGMRILEVTGAHLLAAADIGAEIGLLITDAAHLAVMRERGIGHLATADADFFNIKGITVRMP